VRDARVWHAVLGVEKTVVEDVEFDELDQVLVVRVRPARGAAGRCGVCQRRCGRYDTGEGAAPLAGVGSGHGAGGVGG
jgi:transposase